MTVSAERTYRNRLHPKGLSSFRVVVKETDLWVSAATNLEEKTRDLVLGCRLQLESYILAHSEFAVSMVPLPQDPYAPGMVKEMLTAARQAGVGPMAAVAGAVAEVVGRGLLEYSDQVIVENGGDIFLKAARPVTVSIFAGSSVLSEKLGLRILPRQMPLGVCSSSGHVGHSLSGGEADALTLLSPSSALADAAATALGNRLRSKESLQRLPEWAERLGGVIGGVAIMGDRMATWGDVELTAL